MSEHAERSAPRKSKRRRLIGFVLGLVLLLAAAVYLVADPEATRSFVDQLAHAPRWAGVVVLLGPLFNWVFVSMCLHALNRRHGVITRSEMLALVGSAWLLNHLPMRPGMVGRIGYQARVNQIRVRDSVEASIWSLIHAILATALGLGLALMVDPRIPLVNLMLVLMIPIAALLVLAMLARTKSLNLGLLMMGLVWRYADLLVWMLRYAAAFAMLGVEITPVQIALITAVSQLAQVIPITGGGIGLREWGVGLTATMTSGHGAISMRTAVGADLINRLAETLIVIPLGLVCTGISARRFARFSRVDDGTNASAEDESIGHAEDQDQPGEPGQEHPSDD